MRPRLAPLLLVPALLLTACGDDGDEPAASDVPASVTSEAVDPEVPAGEDEDGDEDDTGSGGAEGTSDPDDAAATADLAAAVEAEGPCGLIDPDHSVMQAVFAGGTPDPSDTSGGGWHECVWEVPEDEMVSGGHLVSVVIGPAAEVADTLTSKATVVAPASGIPDGQMYDGVLGRGRASTKGHAVGFVAGDLAGIVSVRTAADSQPVDGGAATQLVETLLGLN